MTRRVLIIGAGGHGQVIADILLNMQKAGQPVTPIGFLDDSPEQHSLLRLGLPVFGSISDLPNIAHDAAVIGIGDNRTRKQVFDRLRAAGTRLISALHPAAIIAHEVRIGDGTVACAGAILNTGADIGENVILNTGCTVDHHCRIADHVHIAPGVHLGGYVTIAEGGLVGIGATVMPYRHVGAWSQVGAGALVHRNIDERTTVVGVPARVLRDSKAEL
jgi:sugar O-acyltransferase (sialic acid O-acetyltransferase NeuD family)